MIVGGILLCSVVSFPCSFHWLVSLFLGDRQFSERRHGFLLGRYESENANSTLIVKQLSRPDSRPSGCHTTLTFLKQHNQNKA